ncbi:MAG: DUF1616 domain-containing protein [Archaeoglobus sp.]|nr:DUF1616 domain-containing protein [Archaeoglobus sp.]
MAKEPKTKDLIWDQVLVILLCLILIAIILYAPDSILRKLIGLPFILFFPGYSLISFLFPYKKDLDGIERIALSFGMSIAISPLIGLGLNYTPFGIRLNPILFSLSAFIIFFSFLTIERRVRAAKDGREIFYPKLRFEMGWEEMGRLDKVLTVILVISIVAAISALIYVIVTPKQGEKFTEFYILGPSGKAEGYPRELKKGEIAEVIIGIANHEYRVVNYTVEIWLVNATFENNTTILHHMFFVDSFSVTLNHTDVNIEGNWTPQWEKVFNFSINRTGSYKLWFLLFKDAAKGNYSKDFDYAGTSEERKILDAVEGKIQSLNLNLKIK